MTLWKPWEQVHVNRHTSSDMHMTCTIQQLPKALTLESHGMSCNDLVHLAARNTALLSSTGRCTTRWWLLEKGNQTPQPRLRAGAQNVTPGMSLLPFLQIQFRGLAVLLPPKHVLSPSQPIGGKASPAERTSSICFCLLIPQEDSVGPSKWALRKEALPVQRETKEACHPREPQSSRATPGRMAHSGPSPRRQLPPS